MTRPPTTVRLLDSIGARFGCLMAEYCITLSAEQERVLRDAYLSRPANIRIPAHIVLLLHRGYTPDKIAEITYTSVQDVEDCGPNAASRGDRRDHQSEVERCDMPIDTIVRATGSQHPGCQWWVIGISLPEHAVLVQCPRTQLYGVIEQPSADEWQQACRANLNPYPLEPREYGRIQHVEYDRRTKKWIKKQPWPNVG